MSKKRREAKLRQPCEQQQLESYKNAAAARQEYLKEKNEHWQMQLHNMRAQAEPTKTATVASKSAGTFAKTNKRARSQIEAAVRAAASRVLQKRSSSNSSIAYCGDGGGGGGYMIEKTKKQ